MALLRWTMKVNFCTRTASRTTPLLNKADSQRTTPLLKAIVPAISCATIIEAHVSNNGRPRGASSGRFWKAFTGDAREGARSQAHEYGRATIKQVGSRRIIRTS